MRPNSYVGRHVGPLGPFRVYFWANGDPRGSWIAEDAAGKTLGWYGAAKDAYEAACTGQKDQLAQPIETPWQDALWRALGFLSAALLFGLLAWVLLLLHAVTRS